METTIYRPKYNVRFVTAASLFDGHDASINVMRRILQSSGVEVIHLGHNRSVEEVVNAAIQEDVQGIAISSYQGGHVEFFKYIVDLLKEKGAPHIKVFGGGGGVIVPSEIQELHAYGVTQIFSPDDGRRMGLQGMINSMIEQTDYPTKKDVEKEIKQLKADNWNAISHLITLAEENVEKQDKEVAATLELIHAQVKKVTVLGITGTGGAGKSSLTDELVRRYLDQYPDKTIAILSVDPSKQKTGGALLGDRIRMNAINSPRVYMRSLATRKSHSELSKAIGEAINIVKAAGYDFIIVETSGIGQGDAQIMDICDTAMYVMTSEFGAATQLEKIDMIDYADIIAINKFERRGSEDALRDVKKQWKRSRNLFDMDDEQVPVVGTIASQFNDPGTNVLFAKLMGIVQGKSGGDWGTSLVVPENQVSKKQYVIPADRVNYLGEIVNTVREYKRQTAEQVAIARKLFQLKGTKEEFSRREGGMAEELLKQIDACIAHYEEKLHPESKKILANWKSLKEAYTRDEYVTKVRDKEIRTKLYTTSLSGTRIPKVSLPKFEDWGEILRWSMEENVPGEFPYTGGVFPLKRDGEDPKRQFAGEGTPERTNRRFHYLSKDDAAKRLSTAFDSVTLYGEDPDYRPDIYGKIGNSGVSVCTLDDMKKLYAGFDLCHPSTSVSMTINGPAPIILAMYMNTAIQQQLDKFAEVNGRHPNEQEARQVREMTLRSVRGTVQADILKEDQGQNTCIFSTEFALKMMGDIQQYFIDHQVRNYYSVSISGYHIAEAGANPISQLAFTLANGFTYVEYYLSRGMHIDDFAPNLSFFFSNGLDPEYTVLGRVARRIWATVMKNKYKGNERSQKLKYHTQTSGRSLHAQEMDFNDIRTTLQALMAIYDNCNSLHTNAYDEAITTPTENSVRRAMAIQMIITKELGLAKNENPLQGSFIIEELTDLVEEAVMQEFQRISDRGGVLGAMETQYQRGKIQEESLYYETKKHNGELPIIGVNTFINPHADESDYEIELARATEEEKVQQINNLNAFQEQHKDAASGALQRLKEVARNHGNIFEELMETVKVASLGQITGALYEVGGQYRRNM
ncbi:methylmalonyl-CoA mutase family protein [Aneurinibacillus sp. Ricciae_BoGa-3]|uniref:fused isobutyryl-CoA mutase/GTPase IcmF n=1 Tax=Aneurinibacillus sp. Ricciae_BoGa-3 TaxID=3022697 RepID=UPI0023403BCE|nr:fused isobutyryl-CoA mutase/GTPase IcmF [Aneurinibacillus sp. Ricciae_BoGa-3]WCK54378.1 methylmalonyl-CoA mutase family protein [Aneurinibacillus sp. Ricciae_BoGa-3]